MPGAEVIVEAANGLAFSNNKSLGRLPSANGLSPECGWWEEALASSINFKRDVAALMEPSGSAIFMLLRAAHTPIVLKQLRNYGDTIIHASISSEQDKSMLALLATGKGNRS
jgi:hypothetical protein